MWGDACFYMVRYDLCSKKWDRSAPPQKKRPPSNAHRPYSSQILHGDQARLEDIFNKVDDASCHRKSFCDLNAVALFAVANLVNICVYRRPVNYSNRICMVCLLFHTDTCLRIFQHAEMRN